MSRTVNGGNTVVVAVATALAATLAGGGATAVVRALNSEDASVGHLARLLAAHRAGVVADHVAPSAADDLTKQRLQASWAQVVVSTGPLRRVTRTYVVHESDGVKDELELLAFAHGSGTLAVHRTPAGITGLYLLASTLTDTRSASAAASYAVDLATGRLEPVRARFGAQMAAALPSEVFAAETAAATAGLQRPATVAGQVVVRPGGLTVVETYLLFRNGLRRIEMTLDPGGSIVGLYIRPL